MRRLTIFAFGAVFVAACSSGSGSTGLKSTTTADVAGNWGGVYADGPGCPAVSVSLTQEDTIITGTWTFMDCDGTPTGGVMDNPGVVRGDSVYFSPDWGDFAGTVSGNTMTDASFFAPEGGSLVLTRTD
jgi:hypothetical protein